MRLSRTVLKELSKRYKDVLLKCFCLNACVLGYAIFSSSNLYAQTIIPGGTIASPENSGAYSTSGNILEFANGIFELPDMQSNFKGSSTDNTIKFSNATVKLTSDWYYSDQYKTYSYFFDDSTVIDLRYDEYEYQAKMTYGFDNMIGEGASVAFYVSESAGKLISDRLYSETSYLADFDPLLISIDRVTKDKEYNLVQVLDGKAEFNPLFEGKEIYAASTSGYASLSKVERNNDQKGALLQSVQFKYKGLTDGETLASLNQHQGNSVFFHDATTSYQISGDLGVTGFGEKTVKGVGIDSKIVINSDTPVSMFYLKKDSEDLGRTTSLLVKDLTIDGAESVLSSQSGAGNVRFKNVQIIGDNEGLIENGSDLIVENSTIKNLTNTGTATLTNTNVTRALTVASGSVSLRSETPENLVEVKGLTTVSSVLDIKGAGTVVLNGVDGTGQINNAGNLVFKSKNQNEPISLQLDQDSSFLSLKNEGNSTIDSGQNFFKDVVNTGTLVNNAEMIVRSNFKTNNLAGNGTITMAQGSVLNVPPEFETTNNLISKGMLFGENVEKVTVSDLTIAENSTLDIKNIDVTANNLLMAENSVLKVTLNGFSDYGTISGDTIHALEGASLQFNFGNDFSGGVYQILNFSEIISLPLIQNINGMYTFIDLKDGRYSFEQKNNVEELSKLGATRNEINTISALMEEGGNNSSFNEVQRKMKELVQSGELSQIQSVIKASKSLSSNISTVAVSQNMEQFQSLFGAVLSQTEQFEKETGRAGGDETPRSSVWTKAFYSKTKKSGQNDYKTKGTGGILGIQTKVTDDLVIGIGYAYSQADVKQSGRNTDINNNLGFGYFRYQPSGWFVDGLFSYSRGRYEEDKYVLSSHGSADYNVESIAVQSMVGYDYAYKNILLMPKVGLRYMNVTQESYTDTFGTYVGNSSSDYITVMAGVDVKSPYKTVNNFHIRPVGALLLGYDLKTDDMKGVNTLSNGATYVVEGDALARFSWNVKAGIEAELSEKTILKLEYSGSFRSSYQDHGGMLKVEYRF